MPFNETRWPISLKDHRCEWCYEPIKAQEQHAHFIGVFQGDFQDWRMHKDCYADADNSDSLEDGFIPGAHSRREPSNLRNVTFRTTDYRSY